MYHLLSKTLDLAVAPLSWAIALCLVGAWASRGGGSRARRALARFAPLAAATLLFAFSTNPVANALARSLEQPPLATFAPGKHYDAVVVLGGFVQTAWSESAGVAQYTESVDRVLVAWDLVRAGQADRIVVTSGPPTEDGSPAWAEATMVARDLVMRGVAREKILVDDAARNTRENALHAADIARREGLRDLVLVTSAFHMRRALGCFEAVGLAPDTLPVDYISHDPARFRARWQPRSGELDLSTTALREHVGRVVYRLRGWSTR